MKKVFSVFLLLILLLSLLACSSQDSDLVKVSGPMRGGNSSIIAGSIGDLSKNLPDMLNYADLIVIGKVVKQDGFGDYSVMTEVKVSRTVKGLIYDAVSIIQLKDGYELAIGEEYLLALASQQPPYKEDYYAVCGAFQGTFREEGAGIEVFDNAFVPEIQRFIAKGKRESLSIKELADWFETIINK